MISGLNHANILTARLDETVDFFVRVLGLEIGPRPDFPFDGAWLYAGGQPVIHLVTREQAPGASGALDHVAFTVADLDAALGRFDALGVRYRASAIPSGFGRQAFLTDPNGVRIELTEPALAKGDDRA
jgi:catechol 2,3-dioxygenase-like lactoylglutathione lyase family enzyme